MLRTGRLVAVADRGCSTPVRVGGSAMRQGDEGRRPTGPRSAHSVQWETAIRFGCNAARFGITTSSTPCLPLAEMASASAVSGRVNRR